MRTVQLEKNRMPIPFLWLSNFQLCRLGRHVPITKILRDGILQVGKKRAAKEVDANGSGDKQEQWFDSLGDSPMAALLRLYSQVRTASGRKKNPEELNFWEWISRPKVIMIDPRKHPCATFGQSLAQFSQNCTKVNASAMTKLPT